MDNFYHYIKFTFIFILCIFYYVVFILKLNLIFFVSSMSTEFLTIWNTVITILMSLSANLTSVSVMGHFQLIDIFPFMGFILLCL